MLCNKQAEWVSPWIVNGWFTLDPSSTTQEGPNLKLVHYRRYRALPDTRESAVMRRHAAFHFGLFHLVILALGLGPVSGWAAFFIASRSFAETERELRGQVSSLHQIQMDLLREKDRMKAAAGDLEPLQSQLETLRQETNLLTQARDLARAELVTAATGMRNLVDQLNQARSDVVATGSVAPQPLTSEQLVTLTAQKALTRLG